MNSSSPPPFTIFPDGIRLAVRVTPRAKRDAVGEVTLGADGRPVLAVRLAAPPVEGAANKALIAFLAKTLGLPKGDIRIQSGETARVKLLHVIGEPSTLAERLTALLASGTG